MTTRHYQMSNKTIIVSQVVDAVSFHSSGSTSGFSKSLDLHILHTKLVLCEILGAVVQNSIPSSLLFDAICHKESNILDIVRAI